MKSRKRFNVEYRMFEPQNNLFILFITFECSPKIKTS
jgi:hypothetical protein